MTTGPTRFIVLCHGRTGSTLFGSLLASHPAMAWGGEEFNAARNWPGPGRLIYHLGRRYPLLRLNWLAWRQRGKVYGCKLTPNYLRNLNRTIAQVHRHGWLLIHLQRRNTFHEAISGLVAKDTDFYQHFADQTPRGPAALQREIDPDRFLRRMKYCQRLAAMETQALAGRPHMQVWYEDDLADAVNWAAVARRVFDALGLPSVPLQTNVRRTWERSYADIITNYAELVAVARTAGYAHFLE